MSSGRRRETRRRGPQHINGPLRPAMNLVRRYFARESGAIRGLFCPGGREERAYHWPPMLIFTLASLFLSKPNPRSGSRASGMPTRA